MLWKTNNQIILKSVQWFKFSVWRIMNYYTKMPKYKLFNSHLILKCLEQLLWSSMHSSSIHFHRIHLYPLSNISLPSFLDVASPWVCWSAVFSPGTLFKQSHCSSWNHYVAGMIAVTKVPGMEMGSYPSLFKRLEIVEVSSQKKKTTTTIKTLVRSIPFGILLQYSWSKAHPTGL